MHKEFLIAMINLLEENQKFPKYQLERRVDILFNLFLPDIIQWKFGKKYHVDFIIPELPIKKEGNNQSTNLDYFVICNNQEKGFIVELKTDKNSVSNDQLIKYIELQKGGLQKIINGVDQILSASDLKYQHKYLYLKSLFANINPNLKLEIVYILPETGIKKLSGAISLMNSNIHFITLERLKKVNIDSSFKNEWHLIMESTLF